MQQQLFTPSEASAPARNVTLATPGREEAPPAPLATQDAASVAADLYRRGTLTEHALGRAWTPAGQPAGAQNAREWLFEHYALAEDGTWTPPEYFYAGDAYERAASLRAAAEAASNARQAAKFRSQADHFLTLVPFEAIEDAHVTPRDSFVPTKVLQRFVNDVLSDGPSYMVERSNHLTYVLGPNSATIDQFREYLNHATETGTVEREGKSKEQIAAEKTALVDRARALEARFEDQFRVWLYASQYRDEVELAYNQAFNGFVEPAFPALEIEREIPGWASAMTPHPWQREAVQRMLQAGGGVIGLDVGLGKTLAGVMLVMLVRARGVAKRPVVVVPKSLVAKWRDTFREAVPHARVLVVGQTWRRGRWQDDDAASRARKLHLATQRDYDAVLITREAFATIPMRQAQLKRLVERDPEFARQDALESGKRAFRGQFRHQRKDTKTIREWLAGHFQRYEQAEADMRATGEPITYWEDLCDYVVTDEAHAYKNMHPPMTVFGQYLKYGGQGEASDRAMDFYWKAEAVRDRSGGKGAVLLTASIVKNSPMELYALTKLAVGPQAIPGVQTMREFVRRYMDIESAVVLDAQGEVAGATAVVGFRNLQELRGMMHRYIYRRTATEVGMKLPQVETLEHFFEMDSDVREEYKRLSDKIHAAAKYRFQRKPRGQNQQRSEAKSIFELYAGMRKLTLEPGLQQARFAGRRNPRFKLAADLAARAVAEGGRVLMFMDMGQNHEQGGSVSLNAYERLVTELELAGVDPQRVRVATGSTLPSAQSRRALEVDYADGKLDVVIGSTGVIGEGVDLQTATTDIVHLDTPWDPGGYWQRMGRAVRQGSQVERVRAHVLLARGSFDSIMFATMLGKRAWMDVLLEGTEREVPNSSIVDPREELLAAMSEDPQAALDRVRDVKRRIYQDAAKARAQRALVDLRGLGALASSLQRARDLLERNSGSAGLRQHLEQRVETLHKRYSDAAALAVRDPHLPQAFREAVLEARPFLVDVDGRYYAPGSVFVFKPLRAVRAWTFLVESVDLASLSVQFRPLLPRDDLKDTYFAGLADLASSSAHAPNVTSEALHPIVAKLSYEEQGSVDPELLEVAEDWLQSRFRADPPERAFVVTADGWLEERNPKAAKLRDGERYLLNTPGDRRLFESQFLGEPFPFA